MAPTYVFYCTTRDSATLRKYYYFFCAVRAIIFLQPADLSIGGDFVASVQDSPWFVLKVRTRSEDLVVNLLRGKTYDTFLPTYQECRQYSDRIKRIESPLFPGYLFCRLEPEKRLPVL